VVAASVAQCVAAGVRCVVACGAEACRILHDLRCVCLCKRDKESARQSRRERGGEKEGKGEGINEGTQGWRY